jgi:hypothetical protein
MAMVGTYKMRAITFSWDIALVTALPVKITMFSWVIQQDGKLPLIVPSLLDIGLVLVPMVILI